MKLIVNSVEEMQTLASGLGELLNGGEVVELIGDVGAGKTTFTKGLALGLGVADEVQSPSFTISRVYKARDGLELRHFDMYRLSDPGIIRYDIAESVNDKSVVTVLEWGSTVKDVLPKSRIIIKFSYGRTETMRELKLIVNSKRLEGFCATWVAE